MTKDDFTQIGVAGDWHANKGFAKVALNTFAEVGIHHILHVGDFGFWPGNSGQKYLHQVNKALRENSQTLYVTLGNHEDYVQVSHFTNHPDMPGFVYNPDYPHILVATRGARWEWEGVSFVSLGGANSIDFIGRTEWIDWWRAEQISLLDVYQTVNGGHADVMVTHDCPAGVNLWADQPKDNIWSPTELRYANESRTVLRQAVDGVKPDVLLHGHYHFFVDRITQLNDGLDDYTIRTIGLDMDGSQENMGVLSLPSKTFEQLPVTWNPSNYYTA
jgi:Icc-related predicted phosphoesterase